MLERDEKEGGGAALAGKRARRLWRAGHVLALINRDERSVRDFAEPVLGSRIGIREFDDVNGGAMDFRLQKQTLLERAKHQEEKARRQTNAQAQDIMRALAALFREMANELEDSWQFDRRFDAEVCADLARAIYQ